MNLYYNWTVINIPVGKLIKLIVGNLLLAEFILYLLLTFNQKQFNIISLNVLV